MGRIKDLAGQTFGRLSAIAPAGKTTWGGVIWKCLCQCGQHVAVPSGHLRSGHTKSCGCWNDEMRTRTHKTHGLTMSKEYEVWASMKTRCNNKRHSGFNSYGGRGIQVCARWHNSFENFLEDMGACPKGMSIERIDNNKGYSPSNCKWATRIEQARNTRTNHIVQYEGKQLTISAWAKEVGISKGCLYDRISRNKWPIEKALTIPPRNCSKKAKSIVS